MSRRSCVVFVMMAALLAGARPSVAQITMPDPKQISGVPLPASDLPAGTITVRVIRGSFANNLSGVDVTFVVDGKPRVVKTDENGRAEVSGLKPGTRVLASATVGAETLTSQEIAIASGGIRVVLAATDPAATARAAEDQTLAAGPAVKGTIVIGPETRIVTDFADERLSVYYVVEILNTARSPVDIGGPVVLALPREARGTSILEGSSKQAVAAGARVTVTGPFAPGSTNVHVGFSLPFKGATAHISQAFPAPVQGITVIGLQNGSLDIRSPQFTSRQFTTDQGQALVVAKTPALAAGQPLMFDVTGLPHHPVWPQYVALGAAGVILCAGLWAAVFPRPRRRAA